MIFNYLSTFLLSSIITFVAIPKIIFFGNKLNLLDKPEGRKIHKKSIVRVGGLSIFIGYVFSTFFANQLGWILYDKENLCFITQISSIFYFLIGFWDDLLVASSFKRLIAQIIVAICIWMNGIQINNIYLPFLLNSDSIYDIPNFLSLVLTVLWIVGVTNSFNWLDGLDGLSCGLAFIASISFIIMFTSYSNSTEALLIFALAGACMGFLFFNSYPARIFMGDGGAYLLGSNLALFSICANQFLIDNNFAQWSFLFPIFVLFIPLFDMSYVIFSRISEGKLPFFPDRRHLHYKLIDLGYSHKKTVLIFYFFSIVCSTIAFSFIY